MIHVPRRAGWRQLPEGPTQRLPLFAAGSRLPVCQGMPSHPIHMLRILCFLLVALLASIAPLSAQEDDKKDDKQDEKKKKEKKPIAKINSVRVGFYPNNPNDAVGRFKVGLWAPVYVTVAAGEDGLPVKGPMFSRAASLIFRR